MKGIAIIAAAGKGTRAGEDKIWAKIGGKKVIEWTILPFLRAKTVDAIILVVAPERVDETVLLFGNSGKKIVVEAGADSRIGSVRKGLFAAKTLSPEKDVIVAIHDGARPYVSSSLIERCMQTAMKEGSAVPVLPCVDSLRRAKDGAFRAVNRKDFVLVQTPQCFSLERLALAYEKATDESDDATVYERAYGAPFMVEGDPKNKKITYPSDLFDDVFSDCGRVGIGFDVHPLAEGRPLVLGGVSIPHSKGLVGHSDADALTHAIMDALLSAAGLPDIGHRFPPNDPAYLGAYSIDLLKEVVLAVSARGFRVLNVSAAILAEKPKLAPFLPKMQGLIAQTIGIPVENVAFSATTTEKLGMIGEEKGIAAEATVLLSRLPD